MNQSSSIKVLFIASEADPFVKVGGLADVAGSLPRALKEISLADLPAGLSIDIRLVIPGHPQIQRDLYSPKPILNFPIHAQGTEVMANVLSFEHEGLPVYLIGGDLIAQESGVYSANLETDGYKYVFFSLACLELLRQLEWKPDILHANDWHTAIAVYSLAIQRSREQFFHNTKSLLTVHNLPYLGSMTPPALQAFGVPPAEDPDLPSWARQMALPLGLLAADRIVAVSPGYAKEILTEEFGSGLEDFLSIRAAKISGILNGLDTHKWNPTTDKDLLVTYSSDTLMDRISNKTFLQKEMGFEANPRIPLLAMVTRMDPQKGVDLAVSAIRELLQAKNLLTSPMQMVFLGTGNPVLENEVRQLEYDFPQSVRARILFSEQLSHHIYGGADILLMPSRYEPCGLSQMIAMRYGCVPIARATGGLCDTIQDPNETEQSTGFLFSPAKSEALSTAITRAISMYKQEPIEWQAVQRRGMLRDFSWACSAREYLIEYLSLMGIGK
jgi:starch synthase